MSNDFFNWLLGGFCLFFITFLLVDIEHTAGQFVRALGRASAAKLTINPWPKASDVDVVRYVVRAIANHTQDVNRLIWYPFIVMLLLVMARQRIFAANGYPTMLAVVQLSLLVILYFFTQRLRGEAEEARAEILRHLHECLVVSARPSFVITTNIAVKEDLQYAIDDITSEDNGAFGHWTQDYFLRAMALPFSGESGFLLLQKWIAGG